jgi:hypothetical protein
MDGTIPGITATAGIIHTIVMAGMATDGVGDIIIRFTLIMEDIAISTIPAHYVVAAM